jgi:hypothetical protein
LELSVLPSSGGHDIRQGEMMPDLDCLFQLFLSGGPPLMELTGIEPVTSAVRLQRSPS